MINITQDNKDIFRQIRKCGPTKSLCYVNAGLVDLNTYNQLVNLAQMPFVDELEFAIEIKDKAKIEKIINSIPQATIVYKLLINRIPKN